MQGLLTCADHAGESTNWGDGLGQLTNQEGEERTKWSILFTFHISIQTWVFPATLLRETALVGQASGLTNTQLGPAVVSVWRDCPLVKDSATIPLICKAVFPAIRLFLCVLFFKKSPQIYCNLIMNLFRFWLWASSLAYPQIPLRCVLRALLSSSVHGIMHIVHRNPSALLLTVLRGRRQGGKAQGAEEARYLE